MKKLNNKGFTLVELLAVIAILIIIMTIAIPNISSAINRTKNKQDKATQKLIETAGDLYMSEIKNSLTNGDYCLSVQILIDNDYLDEEDVNDYISYSLKYNKNGTKIEFKEMETNTNCSGTNVS